MANRADGASVKADSQLRRRLPQVYWRSDGVEQFYGLPQALSRLSEELDKLQPIVTPELGRGASYGWNGGSCHDDNQRKFIAETYYLYREIYHQLTLDAAKYKDMGWNVYLGETLTCSESGEPIKVERVE